MAIDATNFHVSYPDVYRHWSSHCEQYAGGDALVTFLMEGWTFSSDIAYLEEFWLAGTRPVTVYHFDLARGDEQIHMPVMTNPYVRRVIRMHNLVVKPMSESTSKKLKSA